MTLWQGLDGSYAGPRSNERSLYTLLTAYFAGLKMLLLPQL